jgi:coenzyme PQQ precursor peptide PqqA
MMSQSKPRAALDPGGWEMTWTKPEIQIIELGMEVGAYAGNA